MELGAKPSIVSLHSVHALRKPLGLVSTPWAWLSVQTDRWAVQTTLHVVMKRSYGRVRADDSPSHSVLWLVRAILLKAVVITAVVDMKTMGNDCIASTILLHVGCTFFSSPLLVYSFMCV